MTTPGNPLSTVEDALNRFSHMQAAAINAAAKLQAENGTTTTPPESGTSGQVGNAVSSQR